MESEGQKTFVPLHDFVVEVIQYCKPLHWEEAVACVNLSREGRSWTGKSLCVWRLTIFVNFFPKQKTAQILEKII